MDIIEVLKDNPQIAAALITASCGILGIFINIWINYRFRKKDFNIKKLIHDIEILEKFYIPLERELYRYLDIIGQFKECINFYDLLKKENDSKNDSNRVLLKSAVDKINSLISNCDYNYIGDYKLYVYQCDLIELIYIINNYLIIDDYILINKTIEDSTKRVNALIERIEKRKIRLLSKNNFSYFYHVLHKKCDEFIRNIKIKYNIKENENENEN